MISALWLVPLIVLAVSLWPMLAATRRVVAELAALRDSTRALSEFRTALVRVEDEARAGRRALENLPLR